MAWLILILAGLFEVGFTTCLRFADGFRHPGWTAGFAVCAGMSFIFLDRAARTIPLGTAYAVWVGVGAAGTALLGVLFFNEPNSVPRMLLLLGLVACIAGLKLVAPSH